MSKPDRPVRVARYIRVSTNDQDPCLQADETAAFIERRGWALVETYTDHGMSGARDRRPDLERMLAAARKKKFDAILVWRSDRLFRSLRHMVNVLDELSVLGIDFVSVTEPFDTTLPEGRLMFHLVSAFSQFERDILASRTKAGMAAARRRGAKVGRPRKRVDVAKAIRLRSQGTAMKAIARELGVGLTTLRRALRESEKWRVSKGGADPVPESDGISDTSSAA